MKEKSYNQSDYMALQLMEIENFRFSLSQQSQKDISFHEAALLWVSQGYADEFKDDYIMMRDFIEPAIA